MITEGIAAFINLHTHEFFNDVSTNKYSVVLTISDEEAEKLEAAGVKVKTYDNPQTGERSRQRKFTTLFDDYPLVDSEGENLSKSSIRRGDTLRIKFATSNPHPVHGMGTYISAIRLLAKGEVELEDF